MKKNCQGGPNHQSPALTVRYYIKEINGKLVEKIVETVENLRAYK
jgi:hypothetical protein